MRGNGLWIFFCVALLVSPALAQDVARPAPERATGRAERSLVTAGDHMVVAAHPLAAKAGEAVLAEGGSAVDAMIATQLVLNLVEPQSSGIGGGAFLLHYDAGSRELVAYDGRETAPAASEPGLFLDEGGQPLAFLDAVVGGRSVGTPGTVRLLEHAHRLHGRLPWRRLFEPAIALAREGFVVGGRLAALIAEDAGQLQFFPGTRDYFLPGGTALAAGDRLKNPAFADTLEAIAEGGAEAFYSGAIARDIVDAVRNAPGKGGALAMEDLASYRIAVREPVCAGYRAHEICGMGPPSSGALTVGQILGLLEHFDIAGLEPNGAEAAHLFAEASKLAYADRALFIADPDFIRQPGKGLLDPAYLTARAQAIDPAEAMPKPRAGNPPWRDASTFAPDRSLEIPATSHISIVDGQGDIVSMTTTIEAGFGSRLMVRGFLLNNELTDFSFVPEENGRPVANRVEPGKRPRSSMAPTIVFDAAGEPVLAIGSPGGARIIPYVARTIMGVLDWGLDIQAAIDLPHVANLNGPTELEAGTPLADLAPTLEARGHEVRINEQNSGLHGIALQEGRLYGGVDPRREGAAFGR